MGAKKPADCSAGLVVSSLLKGKKILAMSYFRITFRHTIIGAAAFHGRVRNGNGWFHRAKITRGLGCAWDSPASLGTLACFEPECSWRSLATAYEVLKDTILKTTIKTIG